MARRVRTEAGAKYYGVPIGKLITPDEEDDAKARHNGRSAPHGALTGSNQKRAGQKTDREPDTEIRVPSRESSSSESTPSKGSRAAKTETPEPARPAAPQMTTPTLAGPVSVEVGKRKFSAPEGSVIYKSPNHIGRRYVVTPAGTAHVLTSGGELSLSPEQSKNLAEQVQAKFSSVVDSAEEEETEEVTWTKLMSLIRHMAQAERSGDESEVRRLLLQFREAANSYDPDSDSREVRTRVKRATGVE